MATSTPDAFFSNVDNNTGQHKKALEGARKLQQIYPDLEQAIWGEARSLFWLGRVEEAISVVEKRLPRAEDKFERVVLRHHLTQFEAAAGDTVRAREHLEALQKIPLSPDVRSRGAFPFASAHAAFGDVDAMIEEYQKQSDWWAIPTTALRTAPERLPALREDPRYSALLRKVHHSWGLRPDGSLPEQTLAPEPSR